MIFLWSFHIAMENPRVQRISTCYWYNNLSMGHDFHFANSCKLLIIFTRGYINWELDHGSRLAGKGILLFHKDFLHVC